MSNFIRFGTVAMPISPNPPASKFYIGFNSANLNHLTLQDSSGTLTDLQSGLEYTDEKAQDAIAAAFIDTATANFTYNDGANTMQIDVLPAGVDHDQLLNFVLNEHVNHASVLMNAGTGLTGGGDITASRTFTVDEPNVNHDNLQNFVANEHIDHSTIDINTAANSGLAGGGNITADRNLVIDITNLPAIASVAEVDEDDLVAYYDTSAASHKKIKPWQLLSIFGDKLSLFQDDYLGGSVSAGGLTATVSGTGASGQAGVYGVDATEQAKGVLQIDTGTTAAGRAGLGSAVVNAMFMPAGGAETHYFSARIATEVLSVAGVEQYAAYIGFQDAHTVAGDATDGVYFRYTDGVNGGRWEAVVAAGAVRTAADTGINGDINYHVFGIMFVDGTAVFSIDGSVTNIVTVGLPVGPTQAYGFGWKIEKSVGLTQRNMSADWHKVIINRSSVR